MKNPMGTNSFERLAEAGILGSKAGPDQEAVLAKLDQRIERLQQLDEHLKKVELATANLFSLPQGKRLKRITVVMKATRTLAQAKKLPQGTKAPLTACVNELTSLREGVYTGAATDKQSLTLLFVQKARKEIANLLAVAKAKKTQMASLATDDASMDDFYKQAGDVIEKNKSAGAKLDQIAGQPFMVARVPVVPADQIVKVERLVQQGIKCENLGGYAVLQNQIVLGINMKLLPKKATAKSEAERIKQLIQKQTKTKLQFVSEKPSAYKGAAWFWLMSDHDIGMLKKAFPGDKVKIMSWGFAFN